MSVKFATRQDSPGCIDIVDKEVNITENSFSMIVLCRVDRKIMKYELDLELF